MKLFGTDGIRGVANVDPMTTEMAVKIGRATAFLFKSDHHRPKIVIGKDTRLSGYMLENALASGICSMGVDVLLVGPLSTPGIAFITSSMRADAGVVISASHNPFQDNGIKIFSSDGYKLPDELERRIEDLIFSKEIDSLRPTAREVGKAFRIDDARGRYIVFLKNTFPRELTLEGMKIVVDCAHGATYRTAPAVFEELGARVHPIGISPDGENINRGCGAVHPEAMAAVVKEVGADIGVAFDGDGDRIIFSDEQGEVIDGDKIMAICAFDMKRRRRLRHNTLVSTVMSNIGLEIALRKRKIRLVRTAVGDRYVVEEMIRGGYNFGGEKSGHMVFLDHSTTGDGILSSLQVLSLIIRSGKRLSELVKNISLYPQVLKNVPVDRRRDPMGVQQIKRAVQRVRRRLGSDGRVLIRPSGTEPVIRIMLEGRNRELITGMAEELSEIISKNMKR